MSSFRQNIMVGFCLMATSFVQGQNSDMYSHSTALEPYVVRYGHDVQAVNYFYGPMPKGRSYQRFAASPQQIDRLIALDQTYLKEFE